LEIKFLYGGEKKEYRGGERICPSEICIRSSKSKGVLTFYTPIITNCSPYLPQFSLPPVQPLFHRCCTYILRERWRKDNSLKTKEACPWKTRSKNYHLQSKKLVLKYISHIIENLF